MFAIPAVVWLLSLGASSLALCWSLAPAKRRMAASLISSLLGLAVAWFGYSKVQVSASKTVNGVLQWSINSKWFFLAAMILAAASVGLALWKRGTSRPTLTDAIQLR
jgi:hypothetical protein